MTKLELEVSLIVMSIPTSFALSQEIRIYKNFGKRDITMVSLCQASHNLCHTYLQVIGIMCIKFH